MYDDDPPPNPFDPHTIYQDDLSQPPKGRNCLFVAISIILIVSLISSSVLAFFVVTRRESRPISSTIDDIQGSSETDPTAAPATVVAAVRPADTEAAPAPTALTTSNQESADFIPEINRIALINGDGQIETMSPAGADRRVLTLASDNTVFQFPAWAPDGRRLAVVGSRAVGAGIYMLDDAARTGSLGDRQIYYSADKIPFYLFWSPDSTNLAFLANHTSSTMGLNVVSGDGADKSRLLATGTPFYWDWSDDGRQLLIHSGRDRSGNTLALIDLEGGAEADNLATPGDFQAPGIGYGGRYWAFAEQIGGGLSALVILDTQTGERQAYEQGGSLALSWNPVQDQIAFTAGAVNGHPYWGPLRLLDVATGETRLLTTQSVLAFFWSPDGRSIAFITLGRDQGDDSITADAPEKTRHISRMTNLPAQQSAGGFLTLSIVDVETGQGLRLLDFEPTGVYLSQFLPYFDQYALSHRIWSPDSNSIVLPVREENGDSILIVSADGGRPYRLAEGDIAFWSQK